MERQASTAPTHDLAGGKPDAGHSLKRNAVPARLVTITSLAASGPAASVALAIPVMVAFAGEAAMLALVITLVAVAALVNTFAEFSKRIPSAGSLFAWNSAGLGSNFGFVFGWFFVGCYILIAAEGYSVFGGFVHDYLNKNISLGIPWWIWSAVAIAYVVTFAWRGIAISIDAAFVLLAFEVGVLLLLALWVLISGDAHLHLSAFDPSSSPGGWKAIGLALSFGIVGLAGFEEAATLGEEAEDPRRSVGRGLFAAVIILQSFFIFVGWVLMSSYPGGAAKFGKDPDAIQTIATLHWHSLGGLITLILISSILAFTLTCFNAGIRVIYSLARVGVMPKRFAQTTKHKTPGAAIVLFAAVTVPLCFALGAAKGPIGAFAYYGFMVSVAFGVVYFLTNFALVNYIRKYAPNELSPVRHVLLPLIACVGVGYAVYRTINPLPPAPLNDLPWVILAWAVLGVLILVYLRASGKAKVEEIGRAFAAEWDDEEAAPVPAEA